MFRPNRLTAAMLAIALMGIAAPAQSAPVIIDFEGFAPGGSGVNITPGSPYTEDGFTITPTNTQSAVFDSASSSTMLGNPTDWFGFAESNVPLMTITAMTGTFSLNSLLIGPSTIASATPISMTIIGNLFGGGMVSATFNNLTTATLVSPNFANLVSVQFTATDDAGIDNILLNAGPTVPEPTSMALFGLTALGLFVMRRRKKGGKPTEEAGIA